MISFGALYNKHAKLLPAAQNYWQANWPGVGLEAGQQPWWAALVAGIYVWGITAGFAAAAVSRGTAVHVTLASASYLSSGLAALLGDILEVLLVLGVHPLWALVGCMGTALGIDGVTWLVMRFVGEPWPYQYVRVIATALQLVAKFASATVVTFAVKLADATLLVSAQPHAQRPMHACWCCLWVALAEGPHDTAAAVAIGHCLHAGAMY